MADRVLMPRALDTNGDIVSGAVAYFFEVGTTTPLTIYSDSDALTELGVSATADATGTFPAVYTNQTLRMDIQSPLGVSLPGFPSDSWYIVPANGVGAGTITFEPVTGNPSTTVQTAIETLTALWVAVTAYGRSLIAATDAAAARVVLGLGTAATRAAEDTLTNGSALPDGAAVKAYVDAQTYTQPTAVGDIGTYAHLGQDGTAGLVTGASYAGASLFYVGTAGTNGGVPPGTWRCMGFVPSGVSGPRTIFLRIS